VVERLAPLADDELLLVWLLGEAGAPLTADELVERTAAWRPLGAPRVASWCDDAAGRDIVMQLALLAGGVRVRARFALTPAGAALAARLRAAARHDAPWLRAVQGLAPATDDGLRGALHDVDPRELEDWLAFAHARGLLEARVREHATVWELTAAGRREAGRGVG
jgi:DNA-binding PadR family transcriptional regulator